MVLEEGGGGEKKADLRWVENGAVFAGAGQ